jgi:hypothetical protein
MKIRNGFVSNSSSSSFVINLDDISAKQLHLIRDHYLKAGDDSWIIKVNENNIHGYTDMNNFDMDEYLREVVKVPDELIEWE